MTTPLQWTHDLLQVRDDSCPDCGGPSRAVRFGVSEANPPQKSWVRQRCGACVDRIEKDEAERRSAAQRAEATHRALSELAVPPLYASATLETFTPHGDRESRSKQSVALEFAKNYVARWPDVPIAILFRGGPGSGKGHIAWSIARQLAEAHAISARVCVLSDAIRDLREAWDSREPGAASEAQRLLRYRRPDLLVIDEVSKHAFYGVPTQHLYDLIAWREVQCKPTILTTNESGQALAEFLGQALASRALGWHPSIDFGTADYRLLRGLQRAS